jgi:hypothetical protein
MDHVRLGKYIAVMMTLITLFPFIVGCGELVKPTKRNVTLTWQPPTMNADGTTPLMDLAGYIIYYGFSSGSYTESIVVGNVTRYTFHKLPLGEELYFVITAYDFCGNESSYSNELVISF